MKTTFTPEEFKSICKTKKYYFNIFSKRDDNGTLNHGTYKDANGGVIMYTDNEGNIKPLPVVVVLNDAEKIIARCSAEVARLRLLGERVLDKSYFEENILPDGRSVYKLRLRGVSKMCIGVEE